MSLYLSKFGIYLKLGGIHLDNDPDAVENLILEISLRPHIEKYNVSWVKENKNEVNIYFETIGLDQNSIGKQMAEELFEIACAVLKSADGVHINIIKVAKL